MVSPKIEIAQLLTFSNKCKILEKSKILSVTIADTFAELAFPLNHSPYISVTFQSEDEKNIKSKGRAGVAFL